ncbi:MAG: thioesterase family protein [Ectothiorhodospiraceae bacterium]|nr:thioesterase family protein [Ectothiorhodospiraceae bacterium]
MMTQALFLREGNLFVPTALSGGPWNPEHLHGGPVAGLLAYGVESALTNSGLRLARLTIDLMRAVPKKPLELVTETVRDGRRVQLHRCSLIADGVEVSRATGLFLEKRPVSVPPHGRFSDEALPPPPEKPEGSLSEVAGWSKAFTTQGLHTTAQAVRLDGVRGQGQGRVWMQLPVDVVAGETTSPLVRTATLSDFGNGVGQLYLSPQQGTINTDITLYLHREPEGPWLGLDARSRMETTGMGLVETTLHDPRGPVGKVLQATLAMDAYRP